MRYSTAILAALLGLLQVSASPINVARQDTDLSSSEPTTTFPGGPESTFTPGPFPSGSFSFPSGSFSFPSGSFSFPSGSFSLPSGFPSDISIPPFPSNIAFPTPIQSGPGGTPGTKFPSGPDFSGIPYPSDKLFPYPSDRPFPVPSDKSFPYPSDKPLGAFPSGQPESVPAFPFPGGSAYTAGSVPTDRAPGAYSYSYPTGGPYSFPTGGPYSFPTGGPYSLSTGGPDSFPTGGPYSVPTGGPYSFPTEGPYSFSTGGPYSFPNGGQYSFPNGGPSDIPTPSVVPTKTSEGGEQHPPTFLTSVSSLV